MAIFPNLRFLISVQGFCSILDRECPTLAISSSTRKVNQSGFYKSKRQWHQPGHMQVYTSLQTDNHASNPPLSFFQVGCPSCRPTNSVKALKAIYLKYFVTSMCPISSCQLFTSVSDSSATETYFLKNQLHYNVYIEQVENFRS